MAACNGWGLGQPTGTGFASNNGCKPGTGVDRSPKNRGRQAVHLYLVRSIVKAITQARGQCKNEPGAGGLKWLHAAGTMGQAHDICMQ